MYTSQAAGTDAVVDLKRLPDPFCTLRTVQQETANLFRYNDGDAVNLGGLLVGLRCLGYPVWVNNLHERNTHFLCHRFDTDSRCRIAHSIRQHGRIGLMSCHRSCAVVQNRRHKPMLVVNGACKSGQSGMEEGAVTNEREHHLVRCHIESTCSPHAGSHGQEIVRCAERGRHTKRVTADIRSENGFRDPKFAHSSTHSEVRSTMRTPGT